jgi:hypothetical protein
MEWGNWQDATVKSGQQVIFKPSLQISAPLAWWEHDKSPTQFADGYNAKVE